MTRRDIKARDVITNLDPNAGLCTIEGTAHDYRQHSYEQYGSPHVSLRCVWCHVVACGDVGDPDPCLEPYHHGGDHVAESGRRWPLGGEDKD